MKDRRRFLAPRDLWDAGTIEAWLEEKAAQGWILEKWGSYPRFERIEPRPCRVRLDPQSQRIQVEQEEADALYRDMGFYEIPRYNSFERSLIYMRKDLQPA